MTSTSVNKPWLRYEPWAAREIRCPRTVGGGYVVLAIIFFGGPGILAMAVPSDDGSSFSGLIIGFLSLTFVAVVTYFWLRDYRYGDSVCRLLTLPGVIGGWFKADVECALPLDTPGPIMVELMNWEQRGKRKTLLWVMTREIALEKIVPAGAGHSIVPVRLRVPRSPSQVPLPLEAPYGPAEGGEEFWVITVRKKSRGMDFFAEFRVPIYDTADAPASEQRAE